MDLHHLLLAGLPAHSGLPLIADIARCSRHVAFVPLADVGRSYSITSSARARRLAGTSMPRALAVIRLITRSNLVGCSTCRSAGLAPRAGFLPYAVEDF